MVRVKNTFPCLILHYLKMSGYTVSVCITAVQKNTAKSTFGTQLFFWERDWYRIRRILLFSKSSVCRLFGGFLTFQSPCMCTHVMYTQLKQKYTLHSQMFNITMPDVLVTGMTFGAAPMNETVMWTTESKTQVDFPSPMLREHKVGYGNF